MKEMISRRQILATSCDKLHTGTAVVTTICGGLSGAGALACGATLGVGCIFSTAAAAGCGGAFPISAIIADEVCGGDDWNAAFDAALAELMKAVQELGTRLTNIEHKINLLSLQTLYGDYIVKVRNARNTFNELNMEPNHPSFVKTDFESERFVQTVMDYPDAQQSVDRIMDMVKGGTLLDPRSLYALDPKQHCNEDVKSYLNSLIFDGTLMYFIAKSMKGTAPIERDVETLTQNLMLATSAKCIMLHHFIDLTGSTGSNGRAAHNYVLIFAYVFACVLVAGDVNPLVLRNLTSEGHTKLVTSVAFSPDSNILATGSDDYTAKLWNVSEGTMLHTLQGGGGYDGAVWSVAFSPDGSILATGKDDFGVRLWRVSDGIMIKRWDYKHTNMVRSVAFSPDGTTLATGSDDSTAKLWRVSDGAVLMTMEGHTNAVLSVAFSPDGTTIATASMDGTAKLWMVCGSAIKCREEVVIRAAALRTITHDYYPVAQRYPWVLSVAFSPDGTTLATGADDFTAKLWRVSDGAMLWTLEGHTDAVATVVFSPDGTTLATGSSDLKVKLWKVSDGTELRTLAPAAYTENGSNTYRVSFSPDGRFLATSSNGNMAKIWRVVEGTPPSITF
ncbi:hypothetical protein CYMTET_33382 [Cymbomonas tetramitiformis]|uniref:Uncharacterized protein n=1 Tax=Cymbomonas tetramitiformis TaxID=36881 RepID=A0AAE0FD47_9CHLO|nr:hypothetical protein CYMTET_33382 [Cymbomonas tetramitiformis]